MDRGQHHAALDSKLAYQTKLTDGGFGDITTEIVPEEVEFYYAEDYHQQYLTKNPGGYCNPATLSSLTPKTGPRPSHDHHPRTAMKLDNTFARELPELGVEYQPTAVPAPVLVALNIDLATELELDPKDLKSTEGIAVLAGNLRDVHLKGSGRTPFARGGDGKAALGSMLREFLMAEAMHALNISTARALAVVTTGEQIQREGLEPGAVLTRVAASHIRVGTFEYAAHLEDHTILQRLADHAIARHYPSDGSADQDPTYRAGFATQRTGCPDPDLVFKKPAGRSHPNDLKLNLAYGDAVPRIGRYVATRPNSTDAHRCAPILGPRGPTTTP